MKHRMPFGVEVEGACTRFRLWAPSAQRIDVSVTRDNGTRSHALDAREGGWFETTLDDCPAGVRYAYRIDGRDLEVPDPASRFNPDGVHAASEVVDPLAYRWKEAWRGRRWEEAVVYELHVGTFTPEGTFAAAARRLDDLARVGVTAIELMPVAAFPGQRGWGYDGVLPFAPHAAYGRPDDLKRLVDEAHARGLMVLLDVVYNHFGPEGNYLHVYAPQFFDEAHHTPWGAALDFDGPHGRTVRDFFIHNALYWLDEYRFDGLRLDAVHAIVDESRPDFVDELAETVRRHVGDARHVHLVLENDRNASRRLVRAADGTPPLSTAQWNDDFHHALHVLASGERDGYYADYADDAPRAFARALAEGFVYQGQPSRYRNGAPRGEPSGALPPAAFVSFAQNHDQIGNRAFGERLDAIADPAALRTAIACMLLAPQVPMLFMGEEFAATTPFLYFADFGSDLADAVTRGRREEFARFERFAADASRIPDPMAKETFALCKLQWHEREIKHGAARLAFHRACLAARREHIVPLLPAITHGGMFDVEQSHVIRVRWPVGQGARTLTLLASFADRALAGVALPEGAVVFADPPGVDASLRDGRLPAHALVVALS